MRLRIWLLCCVFVITSAEDHETGDGVVHTTNAPTTVDDMVDFTASDNDGLNEDRFHHAQDSDAPHRPIAEDLQPSSTVIPFEISASNSTISREERMHDEFGVVANTTTSQGNGNASDIQYLFERMHDSVNEFTNVTEASPNSDIHELLERMHDSIITMPNEFENVTEAASNASDIQELFERMHDSVITMPDEFTNVTEAPSNFYNIQKMLERMHDSVVTMPDAFTNVTEVPSNDSDIQQLFERMHDSVITMPDEFTNFTEAPPSDDIRMLGSVETIVYQFHNATYAPELSEIRLHNSNGTMTESANVSIASMLDEARMHGGTKILPERHTNVTKGPLDEDRMHEGTEVFSEAHNNVTEGPQFEIRMHDSTDITEIANSTHSDVTSRFNGPYLRLDVATDVKFPHKAIVHAELSEDEDMIDLEPPRNLELVVKPTDSSVLSTSPVTLPETIDAEIALRHDDPSDKHDHDDSDVDDMPAITEPWIPYAKPQDATPVLSELDRILENVNESKISTSTPEQNNNTATSLRSNHDVVEEARMDYIDSPMNETATNSSEFDSGIPSELFVTDLGIKGRALDGQGRELSPSDQDVCLAVPYPCPPGEACKIDGDEVRCISYNGGCKEDPYPCNKDEACRIIGGKPICFPGLGGVCIAKPYPCNRVSDACRVVDNKVACYPNHCIGVTCSNHGICKELGYDYRCECNPGYEGRNCEDRTPEDLGPCNPNPCRGDCVCKESCMHELGYFCASAGGFTGKNCTVPVPKVTCGERSIVVDITKELYQEFDEGVGNTYFYVAPDSAASRTTDCEASKTRDGLRITIPLPFSNCHSRQARTGSALIVSNRVIADRRSSKFSVETPVVDFQCIYQRQYQLVTSLKPVVTVPIRREGYGRFTPNVELCKISNCPNSCPLEYSVAKGAVYTVGELIYFSVTALPTAQGDFWNYVTVITGMTISCDESGTASTGMTLLRDGCPVDESLYMTVSPERVACASVQTPRSPCATFYIHLHITLCNRDELVPCASGQILRCASSSRQARSIHRMDKYADAKIGPITIITGDIGVEEVALYPGASNTTFKLNTKKKGDAPSPVQSNKTLYTILLTVAVPCLFLALAATLLSLACFKRMNHVADARIMNAKGFKKLDAASPYTAGSGYYSPSASGCCKFCGLIDPLCRCGNKITYTSTKLHAVGLEAGLCPCGCAGPVCQCGMSCQLCSCNSQCHCGSSDGSTREGFPSCLLCSCKSKPCPCGCATGSCQLCTCKIQQCLCGCVPGFPCKCQPPCQLCSCKCECKCNLRSKCSCESGCKCVRCNCSCDKSCKCCN